MVAFRAFKPAARRSSRARSSVRCERSNGPASRAKGCACSSIMPAPSSRIVGLRHGAVLVGGVELGVLVARVPVEALPGGELARDDLEGPAGLDIHGPTV